MTRTLAVLPTGTGKTVCFAHVAKTWLDSDRGRVLIMAHREELIQQAADKVLQVTGLHADIEMGESRADQCSLIDQAPVVITSVQTMCRPNRHERFDPRQFGLLIVDEAHHATAPTYRRVIDHFAQNPDLRILGVTATPDRADEEALGQAFESVAFTYEIETAIQDGWLVPIEQQFVQVQGLDLSGCRTTAGDLNEGDLARIMETEENLHGVVHPALELAGDRPSLFFMASVAHAERGAEIANRHQAESAVCLHGKTPRDERREKLKAFSRGEFQHLFNCGLFLEGFDETSIAVVAMARPTKSRALYAQAVGRGTRPLPGLVDGLDDAAARRRAIAMSHKPGLLVLDFVGNSGRHKLVSTADILGGNYS
jgi:superfamily II DNA or RNA helicase